MSLAFDFFSGLSQWKEVEAGRHGESETLNKDCNISLQRPHGNG